MGVITWTPKLSGFPTIGLSDEWSPQCVFYNRPEVQYHDFTQFLARNNNLLCYN